MIKKTAAIVCVFLIGLFLTRGVLQAQLVKDRFELEKSNAAFKNLLKGEFINLPIGETHYISTYNAAATSTVPIVFIHGLTGSIEVWKPNLLALQENNIPFIALDLLGRGLSDKSSSLRFDQNDFVTQVRQLLDHLAVSRAHIVGMSMGGATALYLFEAIPNRLQSLTLVNSAGLPFKQPAISAIAKHKVVRSFAAPFARLLITGNAPAKMFARPQKFDQNFTDTYFAASYIDGYTEAILSSVAYFDFHGAKKQVRRLAKSGKPVLLYWGLDDKIIPSEVLYEFVAMLPGAEVSAHTDLGHVSSLEDVSRFNKILLQFLNKNQ